MKIAGIALLQPPFELLESDAPAIIPAGPTDTFVRRVNAPSSVIHRVTPEHQTPSRRVEVPTGTVRRV